MPRRQERVITKRTVDALSVEDRDAVFWDRNLPGFGIRVYPSGLKKYVVQSRGPGGSKRATLGRHGKLTADEARRRAAEAIDRIKRGEDPIPPPPDLTLTPTFASGMYTYTASVVSTVAEVTVTPTKNDSGAMIEYLDASDMTLDDANTSDTGHQVAVAEGDTVIKVKVTAADGNATQTYMVTVTRAAAMTGGICDRTVKIQEVILAEISGVDNCAAVTDANLAAITTLGAFGLSTSNQGITSLQKGDFAGLTSLTLLNLSQNSLPSLPEGIFAGLGELTELSLTANQLESLPEGAFSDLTALTILYLSSNNLSSLDAGLFSGLTALEDLFLNGNALESLPEELFSGLTALDNLYLNGNALESLPEGLFSGLTELGQLDLKDNALNALPEGLFSDLTALTFLDLEDNALESLPGTVFSGLTALTSLDLKDNALNALPKGLFSDLTALIQLNLSNNSLNALPDELFLGPTALDQLDLSSNSTNPMELTVTVEKVGTNQVRAKVLAGAPFAVDIPVTPVNGTLEGSVTVLGVAAGAVEGTAVTMTRTVGTTTAATVDVDLTTQPTLASGHVGYIFKKATNLPATILPAVGALSDATLSDLVVNDGTTDLTLTPTFASSKYTYTASVGIAVTEVTVTPTPNDSGATIEYLDATSNVTLEDADTGVTGHQVAVAEGETVIKVKVTAEDGNATQTYMVTVKRAAAADVDATLSALVVNDGRRDLTLRPGFAPGTPSYRVWVVNDVAEVTVMATPNNAEATIEYLDASDMTLADVDTSDTVQPVTLAEGDNVVKVKVTATDTTTTRTYTVTVTRRAVDAPGVEGDLRLTDEDPYTHPDGYEGVAGRVEIFHAERWGTVCSDGFSKATTFRFAPDLNSDGDPTGTFTETEPANDAPALVCQSMGYDTGEYASGYGQPGESQQSRPQMTYYSADNPYPEDGPLPIWLDDLTCAAGDADLTVGALPAPLAHCGYAGWGLHNCSHREDAGVRCWNEDTAPATVAEPLTAAFEGLPEAHDGETAFSFRLAFSEAVAVTPEAMRTRVLTVAGGAATGAARVDGESGVWEITVTPDSREDLSIALAPTEDCEAEGAVCTSDGRALSVVPAHIVPGPGPETGPALTASFEGLPEAHDGEEGFHFRVAFSEEIGIGFRTMRDDSFTVDGGEVTGARRVDRRHDLWRITVEPDGEGDVTVTLAAGRECAVSGAICTRGGDRRQLTNTPTATVAGPVVEDAPAVLTASFVQAPHEHDGETAFKLRIAFSEGISIGFRTFRDQSLSVPGRAGPPCRSRKGRSRPWGGCCARPSGRARGARARRRKAASGASVSLSTLELFEPLMNFYGECPDPG